MVDSEIMQPSIKTHSGVFPRDQLLITVNPSQGPNLSQSTFFTNFLSFPPQQALEKVLPHCQIQQSHFLSFPVGRKMTRANFRQRARRATRSQVLLGGFGRGAM